MALIGEAQGEGDLRDGYVPGQETLGRHDTELVLIGMGGKADRTAEHAKQMKAAEPRDPAEGFQGTARFMSPAPATTS